MDMKTHLIERLRALCAAHGVTAVADEADASEENLRQILAGTKLPSGQPRGVGPNLQKRLEEAFPGWASPTYQAPPTPDVAPMLVDLVISLTVSRWVSIRAQLDRLPGRPDMRDDVLAELQALIQVSPGKPQHLAA